MSNAARKARKKSGEKLERTPKVPTQKYQTREEKQASRRRIREAANSAQALIEKMAADVRRRNLGGEQ